MTNNNSEQAMTPSKPYLIRAIYEWIVENEKTPYLLVDATYPEIMVPEEHIHDGRIILNISPMAIEGLILEDDCVCFNARFSGEVFEVYVPIHAALALYAAENGKGMVFPDESEDDTPPSDAKPSAKQNKNSKSKVETAPYLKIVK